jgi:hypothetical protein
VFLPFGANAVPAPTIVGDPTTYVQDSDGCTGGCGIDTNNTVKIWSTNVSDVYQITVSLDSNGWTFMKDPTGNGHDATFLFSSTSNALTISNIVSNGGSIFTQQTSPPNPTHDAPYTFPANGYGLSNSEQKKGNSLTFDVTSSSSSLALFIATLQSATGGSDNPFFVADVSNANTGNTGSIDFGLDPVPLPSSLPLFAGGLGLMVYFARRRKQSTEQAIAVA